jgi:uncharacterized glyoxalase superfamily protein PhnB
MSKVSYLPKDYNSVTPYLIIKGAAQAIEYYKKVFGATETVRMGCPDGKIGHAELKIGNSHIMLADENPSMGQGHTCAPPLAPARSASTFICPMSIAWSSAQRTKARKS